MSPIPAASSRILVVDDTAASDRYSFASRGLVEVKGKGLVEAWTLGGA